MQKNRPNQEIVQEIYRALVLLGAKSDILGTVGSWGNSLPDGDVLTNLKAWNADMLSELKGRTEHFEMTFHRQVYSPDESQRMSL